MDQNFFLFKIIHILFIYILDLCRFPYPREINVDAENCDATFNGGVLTAIFDITQIFDKVNNKLIARVKKKKNNKEGEESKKDVDEEKLEEEEAEEVEEEEEEEEEQDEVINDKKEQDNKEKENKTTEETKPKKMSIQRKRGKKPADV